MKCTSRQKKAVNEDGREDERAASVLWLCGGAAKYVTAVRA